MDNEFPTTAASSRSNRRRYQRRCSVTEVSLQAAQKLLAKTLSDKKSEDTFDHVGVNPVHLLASNVTEYDVQNPQTDAQETRTGLTTLVESPACLVPAFPLLPPEVTDSSNSMMKRRRIEPHGYRSHPQSIVNPLRKKPKMSQPSSSSKKDSTPSEVFTATPEQITCDSSLRIGSPECSRLDNFLHDG